MGDLYWDYGLQYSLPRAPTIGAEYNVDKYQWEFINIANTAIGKLSNALGDGTLDDEVNVQGHGAAAGDLPSLGVNYNTPAGIPSWDYTFGTITPFNPSGPIVKALTEDFDIADPGDAPENNYNVKTEFSYPTELTETAPTKNYTLDDVVIPDPPELGDIADPAQYTITIPDTIGDYNIPAFTGTVPTIPELTKPNADITWTEEDYDSAILQATQSRISEFLAGGVGIPDAIWDSIWNRAKDKTIRETNRLITEISEDAAARGWSLPTGAEIARIDEARTAGFNQLSEHARELAIKQAEHEIENLKFAVAQGKALEQMLGDWYQQRLNRLLEVLKFTFQATVEVFNAQVTFFKTQVELFNVEASHYKTVLEGALAELQAQKIYLEGQQVIGQLNELEVRIYEANLKAYATELEGYNSKVKGLMAKAENNNLKVQGYKTEVEAFGELVRAKTLEYQALESEIKAESMKLNLFETEIKAYATEVDAYGKRIDAAYRPNAQRQLNNENEFKKIASAIDVHNTKLKDRLDSLNAYSMDFKAQLDEYQTKVDNEKARTSVKLDEYKTAASIADMTTRANIASADNYTKAAVAEVDTLRTTSDMMSRAYSQLAASALGAINVSASIQDSTSNSTNQSISMNGGDV